MKKKIFLMFIIILFIIAIIYIVITKSFDTFSKPTNVSDKKDIFEDYYENASNILSILSLDEKIGQIFLVRYPDENAEEVIKKYHFAGFVLFEKDFKNKTLEDVKKEISRFAGFF